MFTNYNRTYFFGKTNRISYTAYHMITLLYNNTLVVLNPVVFFWFSII